MEMFYTLVDANDLPVKVKVDKDCGYYELSEVSLNNAVLFKEKYIAEGELNNINRIKNNPDYYDLYVNNPLELPLKVMGVKSIRQLFVV